VNAVIAQTKNLKSFVGAIGSLKTRAQGTPQIVAGIGPVGTGKSTAVAWVVNQVDGFYIRAWPTWTPTSMLGAIAEDLGCRVGGRTAPMLREIIAELTARPMPLFIDEADCIADKLPLLELLRGLHDVGNVPLILMGTENFARNLSRHEQITSRVAEWVRFLPIDLSDARVVADTLAEVAITNDLLAEIHSASVGSIRSFVMALARVETWARKQGLQRVDAPLWSGRELLSSPVARLRKFNRAA
jgi:DNA transposition AAA+ family ATPase